MAITLNGDSGITTPTYGGTDTSEYLVPVTGFKNRIINGAMGIWQRGTSFSSDYTADRWQVGGTSMTITRSTDVPNTSFQYSTSFTGSSNAHFKQKIESVNCYDLAGQTITISFWLKQTTGAGAGAIGIALYVPTATDNYTSVTKIDEQTINTTSSWAYYTATFINLDSSVVRGLQPLFYFTSASSQTFLITGVQLEKGSTATSFDYRPYGAELQLCQRYYWKTFVVDTAPAQNIGAGNQIFNICTNNVSNGLYFPVSMRATPTITTFNPYGNNSSFRVPNSATDVAVTPSELSASGIGFFTMTRTAPSALHGQVTASSEL